MGVGETGYGIKRVGTTVVVAGVLLIAFWCVYHFANVFYDRIFPPATKGMTQITSSQPLQSSSLDTLSPEVSGAAGSSSKQPSVSAAAGLSGIFQSYETAAQKKLSRMSLKEKVGQVFLFECPQSGAVKVIDDYQPGGYCLSGKTFQGKTAAQVKESLKAYQNSSRTPMILCCDEEGGTVVRISGNRLLSPSKFLSPSDVFSKGGYDAVRDDSLKKAKLLASLGVNCNLAPVCDLSTDPNAFMYKRSFGKSAEDTAKFVTVSVHAYQEKKIGCVLKHFPGYGNTADTHTAVARDSRSFQTFQKADFLPFEAGMKAGAACVMVSHCIVECMDAEHPASLSPQVHDILREKLGFSGVIMTDSLSMGAIADYAKGENPVVEAFQAGNDFLLTSDISASYKALYKAVQSGKISQKRLDQSVLRIIAWKMELGLL